MSKNIGVVIFFLVVSSVLNAAPRFEHLYLTIYCAGLNQPGFKLAPVKQYMDSVLAVAPRTQFVIDNSDFLRGREGYTLSSTSNLRNLLEFCLSRGTKLIVMAAKPSKSDLCSPWERRATAGFSTILQNLPTGQTYDDWAWTEGNSGRPYIDVRPDRSLRIRPHYVNERADFNAQTSSDRLYLCWKKVPPFRWVRLAFDVHYFPGSRQGLPHIKIEEIRDYDGAVGPNPDLCRNFENQTNHRNWEEKIFIGDSRFAAELGYRSTVPTRNFSWWDSLVVNGSAHPVFHVRHELATYDCSTINFWMRVSSPEKIPLGEDSSHYGYIEIRNVRIEDNPILDDVQDGGVPATAPYSGVFTSLRCVDNGIPEGKWIQKLRMGAEFRPNVASPVYQEKTRCAISDLFSTFARWPGLGGIHLDTDEFRMLDWRTAQSPGESLGEYFANVSQQVYEISPALVITAYGDAMRYQEKYSWAIPWGDRSDPNHGGLKGLQESYRAHGGRDNILWVDWYCAGPGLTENLNWWKRSGLPWLLGIPSADLNEYNDAAAKVWRERYEFARQPDSGCRGLFIFGDWHTWKTFIDPHLQAVRSEQLHVFSTAE